MNRLPESEAEPDPADNRGWTPLMLTAGGGYAETVRGLLEADADSRQEKGAGRSVAGVANDAGRKAPAARQRELEVDDGPQPGLLPGSTRRLPPRSLRPDTSALARPPDFTGLAPVTCDENC